MQENRESMRERVCQGDREGVRDKDKDRDCEGESEGVRREREGIIKC